jgi:hypothetical protein
MERRGFFGTLLAGLAALCGWKACDVMVHRKFVPPPTTYDFSKFTQGDGCFCIWNTKLKCYEAFMPTQDGKGYASFKFDIEMPASANDEPLTIDWISIDQTRTV